ncbi:hypothetical protein Daus18300_013622, partial [Diaporthe australafricana]
SFTASDDGAYDTLTGEIQVFESALERCDPFNFTYDLDEIVDISMNDVSHVAPDAVQDKLRPWCYAAYNEEMGFQEWGRVAEDSLPNSTVLVYKCTNSTSIEDQDHRILTTWESWLSYTEVEVSGFMCEPKYSLTRRVVTNNTDGASGYNFYDDLNITGAITEILDIGTRPLKMTQKILDSASVEATPGIGNTVWYMWFQSFNITRDPSNFRNTSLAIEEFKYLWPGRAAYFVKRDYTYPSNETIKGTTTSVQGRLCVQELPLRLVEALIALLFLSTVALCFLQPGAFHRDPTSLGAHVMILTRSPDLMALLEDYGAVSKQALRASIPGFLASYPQHRPPDSAAITLQQIQQGHKKPAKKAIADNSGSFEWWRPVAVCWWFRTCILTITLGVVITLEVLLQISASANGLGNVSLDGYLKYTWTLLPTVMLGLIGLLFSMVDSTARILHPFQLLRQGRASLADILRDPTRQVSLMAIARAASRRQFALLLAILPGLLAPILTIITSGLYTVVPIPWTYATELQLKTWFRPENRTILSDNNVVDDSGEAWTMFSLMQFLNESYPEWTHGEYALSRFGADNLHSHNGNDTSLYVTARVPATRINLNCSLIDHYAGDTYQTIFDNINESPILPVDPRPLGCATSPEWNGTNGQRNLYLNLEETFNIRSDDGDLSTYQGYYLTMLYDDYPRLVKYRDNVTLVPAESISVCGDGRQHYFIGLGNGTEALSLLRCVPYVEALWVTAAFSLPDLLLIRDVPVAPDTDSSVFLSDSPSMTAFPRLHWADVVTALINGNSGVGQLAALMPDPDDNDASRFITAVEGIFAQYFAQILHFNYRHPMKIKHMEDTSTCGSNPFTPDGRPPKGTVTDRTRLRVMQNTVSTRVLQGLLGVMAVCLITESVLVRGGRVIPRDPGSVASRMAYFAGGALWRQVPVGADRWGDEEVIKWGKEISEGKLLMGWWGDDDQEGPGDGARLSAGRGKRFAVDSLGAKGAI